MNRKSVTVRLLFSLVALFLLTGALPAAPLAHTTITVTTTNDELRVDGDCSLREAIQAANSNLRFDRCPAGSDYDTIRIPAGTFRLRIAGREDNLNRRGDLDLRANIRMVGAGYGKTFLDGNNLDRVLDVRLSTISVTISDLTIQNGYVEFQEIESNDGGGIYNRGKLSLSRVRVRYNLASSGTLSASGGGIFNAGTLAMTDSYVYGNDAEAVGGAITSTGRLTLTRTRVNDNRAYDIGGLLLGGASVTTIRDSRILNNRGGEAWGDSGGNALYLNAGGRLLVERTRIEGNEGNSIRSYGTLTFREVTLNTGGDPDTMAIEGGVARISDSRLIGGGRRMLHVRNAAQLTVERSTAYNLTGIFLYQEDGIVKVVNSTISGVTAKFWEDEQGVFWLTGGRLSLESDTIADTVTSLPTVAGMGGTLVLHNTIIAQAHDEAGLPVFCQDVQVSGGAVENQGYNVFGSVCPENNLTLQSTDRAGTGTALLDPLLGPLQLNGGKTPTRALLPGSPAINAGDPALYMPTDQRGITRPQGTRPDVGAVEREE